MLGNLCYDPNSNLITYPYNVPYNLITCLVTYLTLTLTHEKDPKDPNVPSLRYVNVPKKTTKKTLITC